MQAADAESTLSNQLSVLAYISRDANILVNTSTPTDPNWYYVAQWGFNIARADCTAYLDNLFILARERTRTNGLFLDISSAATAIVTATAPHSAALSIIAPAFGLAGNVSNRVFDSYLFSDTAPGLIQTKVRDLQDKYVQVLDPKLVVTSAAAYATIQGYYNYCLPQSIEGILLEKIAGSKATVTDPGGGTPPAGGAAPLAAARSSASVPARMVTPKIILQ